MKWNRYRHDNISIRKRPAIHSALKYAKNYRDIPIAPFAWKAKINVFLAAADLKGPLE